MHTHTHTVTSPSWVACPKGTNGPPATMKIEFYGVHTVGNTNAHVLLQAWENVMDEEDDRKSKGSSNATGRGRVVGILGIPNSSSQIEAHKFYRARG